MRVFGFKIKDQELFNKLVQVEHDIMIPYDLGFGEFKAKHNRELLEVELLQCQQLPYDDNNLEFVRAQIDDMYLRGMITPDYEKIGGVTFEGVFDD